MNILAASKAQTNDSAKQSSKNDRGIALGQCLDDALSRLGAEKIFNHPNHNFKKSGDKLRGGCPFHQSQSGSSFVVTASTQLFWCEGCQTGGNAVEYRASLKVGHWVKKPRGRDFINILKDLAAEAGVDFPEYEPSPEQIEKAAKWEKRREILAATHEYCYQVLWSDRKEALEARNYLIAERGLTEEEIKQLPIGYYPSQLELRKHLTSKGFTSKDWKGTGCAWKEFEGYCTFLWNDATGRPLTIYGRYSKKEPPEGKPKTIAAPGARTKKSPMYLDRVIRAGHKEAVLVEGVLDAVLLQAKGDTRVCAYVAASCSGDQIQTLQRRGITKVTLCGDPDHGGEKGTNSNLLRLTEAGISVYIAPKLPDELDPDEFLIREGLEGWNAHINAAVHGFRWKAQRLVEVGDTSTDKGKADVLKCAISFCKAVKNHSDLHIFFWPIIRSSLGMEPEEFRTQLEKLWESSPVAVPDLGGDGDGGGGDGGGGDGGGGDGKVLKFPGFELLSIEQVTSKIDELIATGVTGSYLTGQLNRLAAACQVYVGELRKLYYERVEESDLECERDGNRDEIETLLNLNDQSLDLTDYLPQSLAQPITQWCEWLEIRPAVALTAILAGFSSVHKAGTELVLHRNQNFRVPSTIFAALVSNSGQKKSPIFHNMIRRSLNTLEKEKRVVYEAALEDYKAKLQAWERNKKGAKPEEPKDPTIYYFTNATGEAIPVQAAKDPSKSLLALMDELSGYFNSTNAYRGGRGSDKQDFLSYFDGSGQTVLRASGVRVNIKNIYLSIFGTIQPEVLKRHMEDCSDPDGQWARFLFVNQPLRAATLHDDDGMAVQISDRLTDFYRRIDLLPEMEYRLSPQAFKQYQRFYNHLERLRVTHPKSGMAAVYSKMEGYIGRLALNLHVLWELDAGSSCPSEEIPLFIMEMAIGLAKFYIGQVKLIHANADSESLPAHLVKLVELSKRLETNGKDGWIKAQAYRDQFESKKRPSAQQARDWMNEVVKLGHGRTRGTGNRLEFHWLRDNNGDDNNPPRSDNSGKLREDLGKTLPVVETIETKGVENNLGKLGKDTPNLNPNKLYECSPDQSVENSSLKGGSVPEPSLSTTQKSCDVEPVSDTDLGNNLGKPFPNSSLSSLNSTQEAITTPLPLCENPFESTEASANVETPTTVVENESIDFSDFIAKTNIEMKRIGWTKEQGKEYLLQTYGKRSRQLLTDGELAEFLARLENLPANSDGVSVDAQEESLEYPQEQPTQVVYQIELIDEQITYICELEEQRENIYKFMILEEPFDGYIPRMLELPVDADGQFIGNVKVTEWYS